jgi:small-conductance mechanosensitive channel/CRP-like cAMP-binding protein
MIEALQFPEWMWWGLALIMLVPFATIAVGEALEHRSRADDQPRYHTPLTILRNSVLPSLFLIVLLRKVAGFPADHLAVRLADTVFGIVSLNCALAFMNVLVFGEGAAIAGRIRIPRLLLDILRLFFVACGAAIIISTVWNVNLGSLVTALGVGSVVIGLALQDTLGSLFSGIALVSARHFGVGDWIKFGNDEGQVLSMNWRSVTIRTRAGDALVLPNGVIARQPVTVIAAGQGSTTVGVDLRFPYQYSPDLITKIMVEAARMTKDFHFEPAPAARVAAFEDNGIRFGIAIRAVDPTKLFAVRSEYLSNVWFLAQRNGIVFPGQFNKNFIIPPESVPRAATTIAELTARVRSASVFPRSTREGDLADLLKSAQIQRFRDGQVLAEQGSVSQTAYIVLAGAVRATVSGERGAEIRLHEFETGQLVLSKAALRQSGLGYGLRAIGATELVAMPIADFKEFCSRDLHLAQEIEQILSAREDAAERLLAKAMPGRVHESADSDRADLLKEMFRT